MTPTEILRRECEEITSRTGYHVPTYRLNNLLRTAQKVFDVIVKTDALISYHECMIILRIVMGAIREVTGEEVTP